MATNVALFLKRCHIPTDEPMLSPSGAGWERITACSGPEAIRCLICSRELFSFIITLAPVELFQQLVDMHAVCQGLIPEKAQLWDMPDANPAAQLAAEKAGGAFQAFKRLF